MQLRDFLHPPARPQQPQKPQPQPPEKEEPAPGPLTHQEIQSIVREACERGDSLPEPVRQRVHEELGAAARAEGRMDPLMVTMHLLRVKRLLDEEGGEI